jgi:hypothetical protein
MIKRYTFISFIVVANTFLFAAQNNLNISFSELKFNYKEYEENKVIDSEANKISDLPGINIKYITPFNNYIFLGLNLEYNKGKTKYSGAYLENNQNVSAEENNVYILNTSAFLKIRFLNFSNDYEYNNDGMYFNVGLGYRYWNRGKTDISGDYNEKYKWPYYSVGIGTIKT